MKKTALFLIIAWCISSHGVALAQTDVSGVADAPLDPAIDEQVGYQKTKKMGPKMFYKIHRAYDASMNSPQKSAPPAPAANQGVQKTPKGDVQWQTPTPLPEILKLPQ